MNMINGWTSFHGIARIERETHAKHSAQLIRWQTWHFPFSLCLERTPTSIIMPFLVHFRDRRAARADVWKLKDAQKQIERTPSLTAVPRCLSTSDISSSLTPMHWFLLKTNSYRWNFDLNDQSTDLIQATIGKARLRFFTRKTQDGCRYFSLARALPVLHLYCCLLVFFSLVYQLSITALASHVSASLRLKSSTVNRIILQQWWSSTEKCV